MQGTSLTKQERECKLYDEFDKFAYKKGESLREFYLRFSLLLNDMNIYNMKLEQFQVNTKFLNTLPPEWSKFVTDVKLSQQYSTHQSSTPLSITYPSNDYQSSIHHNIYSPSSSVPQMEYPPSVDQQSKFSQQESGLIVPVFQKGDDPIDAINHMMSFLTAVVTSRYPTTNNQLRNSSNPRQQATINNGRVTLQPIQGRQTSVAAGTSRTYTPGASGNNSGKQRTVICYNCKGEGHMSKQCTKTKEIKDDRSFKDKVFVDQAQANDALSEVHNHDNVNNDMTNQVVQAMPSSEQSNVVNHSETEITSDSNIIPYTQYLIESQQFIVQDNMENKSVNDTLTIELERYKEQVKVLKEGQNIDLESHDNVSDSCAQSVKIDHLKRTLLEHLKEKESLLQTKEAAVLRDLVDHIHVNYPLDPTLESACNTKKDKIQQTQSSTQKNEVEAHPRKVKSSLKNKDHVVAPKGTAHVQHSKLNANSELKCVKCNGCMLSDNHDLCVLDYINNVNAREKSKSAKKQTKRKVWKPTGKMFTTIGYIWRPTGRTFTIVRNVCPLTRITTTTEEPLRKPVVLDNETSKPTVTLVYSRKPRNSKTNFPVIKSKVLQSVSANKKEPSKSWGSIISDVPSSSLNECRSSKLSFVKFVNDHVAKILGYGDYQIGNVTISRVYYVEGIGHNLFSIGQFCDSNLEVAFRQHTCFIRNLEGVDLLTRSQGNNLYTLSLGDMMASSPIYNGTEFVNQTLREYYEKVGIFHETSVACSPQQNGVVKRRNRSLVEPASTMLIYAKAPLFLWAEAVATACYTQNRSIIRLRHGKTPYVLLHDKLPDLSFFHVFGALCYPMNDSENLGKLQPKADIDFDELTAMAFEHSSSGPTLHEMTPATISSGLVPNPSPSTPFVPHEKQLQGSNHRIALRRISCVQVLLRSKHLRS
ncbi:retrovirus-related pol polyprotein from transposon TNT 1-94 [Tanacetum coccineum]